MAIFKIGKSTNFFKIYKYIFINVCLLVYASDSFAQIIDIGNPKSWDLPQEQTLGLKINKVIVKEPFKKRLKKNNKNTPNQFGLEIKVNLGLYNSGHWIELPNKDRIWLLNVTSQNAKSINFIFDDYLLPKGATLHIYDNDREHLQGAYTNKLNRKDHWLGTWPLEGSNIWIEYYEPFNVKGEGVLHISKVIHGYRDLPSNRSKESKSLVDCNYDVNCEIGNDFNTQKERLKHAVVLIVTSNSFCTGVLINNSNNDKTPYVLTANHCNIGEEATWAFRFNYFNEENSECLVPNGTIGTSQMQITNGATKLASNIKSDFKLLHLDGGLNEDWDLEWAGWDRNDKAPPYVVGIHHPNGKAMEICRDNDAPLLKTIPFGGESQTAIWKTSNEKGGWEIGITAGGSSGSPLFNPSGKVIGVLTGGFASCDDGVNNGFEDWYGRFNVSWDFGEESASRLSNWLDPNKLNIQSLGMLSEELNPTNKTSYIYPNPANNMLVLANSFMSNNSSFRIYAANGLLVLQREILSNSQQVEISSLSEGIYIMVIEKSPEEINILKLVVYRT